jgi:pimeloyl-ACP methyl ester carboxylesterase
LFSGIPFAFPLTEKRIIKLKKIIMKEQMGKNRKTVSLKRKIRMAVLTITLLCVSLFFSQLRAQVKNIVLVHGAWADGSGWEAVYKILVSKGYNVSVVGNSDFSLDLDVQTVKNVLAQQTGPVILVGHSYGGAIITQAGDTSSVVGLVYIAAFAPDLGESLASLGKNAPANPDAGFLPPQAGFVWYDKAKFHRDFCPDLSADQAKFMADSQLPLSIASAVTPMTSVAWKNKPVWYLVASDDRMIPPDAERFMGKRTGGKVSEIKSSHAVYVSHPKEVAALIETAAKSVGH